MIRKLANFLFLSSFVLTALNIQGFLELFVPGPITQIVAYGQTAFVLAGIIIYLKIEKTQPLPRTVRLWFVYFALFFSLGIMASIVNNREVMVLATSIPVVFLWGFAVFLNLTENRTLLIKSVMIVFTIANGFLIYFDAIGFSLDFAGISEYELERAGGLYGDANNAALVSLLSFVFIKKKYFPETTWGKLIKVLALAVSLYALALTFSKTGFVIFFIISGFLFSEFINPKRLLFATILLPVVFFFGIHAALNSPVLSPIQKNRIRDVINIFTLNTQEVSASDRDVLLQNLINKIEEKPFLGHGLDFSAVDQHAHNTYFGIWADAGIIPFIAFIFLFWIYYSRTLSVPVNIRNFVLPILIIMNLYMFTLQTVINQPYLIALFPLVSYLVQKKE